LADEERRGVQRTAGNETFVTSSMVVRRAVVKRLRIKNTVKLIMVLKSGVIECRYSV
jgi:hypothetical protein